MSGEGRHVGERLGVRGVDEGHRKSKRSGGRGDLAPAKPPTTIKIAGVTAVDVDLATGKVTVTGSEPMEEALVRDAVEEAGYEPTAVRLGTRRRLRRLPPRLRSIRRR